jgi:hypothetical protein
MSHGDSMHHDSPSNRACRAAVTVWMRVAIVTLCLAVHACDTGRGGAVELSWKLRPMSGTSEDPFVRVCHPDRMQGWDVATIRLSWTRSSDGTCPMPPCSKDWNCDENHGATGFELPEGIANLLVTPACSDGSLPAPDTYIAPAIVQRDVIRGETVSLGAVELVVATTKCKTAAMGSSNAGDQSCICGTQVMN